MNPIPQVLEQALDQVQLQLEDLALASGSQVQQVASWIDGEPIPQAENQRLGQLGILVSGLSQAMPAGQVRDWLYQDRFGPERCNALQAISRGHNQQLLAELEALLDKN